MVWDGTPLRLRSDGESSCRPAMVTGGSAAVSRRLALGQRASESAAAQLLPFWTGVLVVDHSDDHAVLMKVTGTLGRPPEGGEEKHC